MNSQSPVSKEGFLRGLTDPLVHHAELEVVHQNMPEQKLLFKALMIGFTPVRAKGTITPPPRTFKY